MQHLSRLAGALFFLIAVLQYNDPDPLRWVVLYGLAGLASFLLLGSWPSRLLCAGVLLASTLWAAVLLPGAKGVRVGDLFSSMQAMDGRVEVGREIGGLLVIALWMAVALAAGSRRRPVDESSSIL